MNHCELLVIKVDKWLQVVGDLSFAKVAKTTFNTSGCCSWAAPVKETEQSLKKTNSSHFLSQATFQPFNLADFGGRHGLKIENQELVSWAISSKF